MKKILILVLCLSQTACSMLPNGFNDKDPRANLFAKEDPHFNTTRASNVLACIGDAINKSDAPDMDLIVSGVRDQTKPVEVPGLLATDNTMMATVAVDRLNTNKITVIGSSGAVKDRPTYQLVGAFTELNRTYNSTALGGSARLGAFEFDMGNDAEWNHIALDLGLTRNGRLVNGMTVSVSISLQNNNRDGNLSVSPGSTNSGVIAIGFRTKEGIHAAQRLLVETATAVLIAKLYHINASNCFEQVYKEQADFKDVSIPQYYQNKDPNSDKEIGIAPDASQPVVTTDTSSPSASSATGTIGTNCRIVLGTPTMPTNWRYDWNGTCDGSNLAEGEGQLRIYVDNQLKYKYLGSMEAGQMHGSGRLDYQDQHQTYTGAFERGNPTGDGIIDTPHGRYRAQYSSETRTLKSGSLIH